MIPDPNAPKPADPVLVVEFLFDFMSPYSYLAASRVEALLSPLGATVAWRPVHLRTLIVESGNKGITEVPSKLAHTLVDLGRFAARYGLPLAVPPSLIASMRSTLPLRAALVAEQHGRLREFAAATFHAFWGEGRDLLRAGALEDIAASVGIDAPDLAKQAASRKPEVLARTREALGRGVYGVPTFFVGDEMFVGNDRLDFVVEHVASRRAGASPRT